MATPSSTPEPPSVSWTPALIWAFVGLLVTLPTMILSGMPAGDLEDLARMLGVMVGLFGLGGSVTGYRDQPSQANRNLLACGFGSLLGVALVVLFDVVNTSGIDVEALGDVVFGVGWLGTYVAGVGAVAGFIGLALGRFMSRRSSR